MLDARVAIGQGDYERAYTTLLEGLPDIQVSTHQHDLLAAVMVRTSRYAEAAAVYRGLLALNSTNTRWWAGYAVTQEKLGRHSELVGAYRTLRTLAQPGTPLAAWAEEQLQRIG
jgi:Flp pilus assembly protein TadD